MGGAVELVIQPLPGRGPRRITDAELAQILLGDGAEDVDFARRRSRRRATARGRRVRPGSELGVGVEQQTEIVVKLRCILVAAATETDVRRSPTQPHTRKALPDHADRVIGTRIVDRDDVVTGATSRQHRFEIVLSADNW